MRSAICRIFCFLLLSASCLFAQSTGQEAPRFFETGMNALTGVGPTRNDQVAIENLRRSADLGYAPAQVMLGYIYEVGAAGQAAQSGQAIEWYKKAAKQDDRVGDWLLGRMYFIGAGVPRDLDQAAVVLKKAANQGDPFGAYLLGMVLLERSQFAPAAQAFRKAAMLGLPQAQQQLGSLLKQGQGVPQDKSEAYVWTLLSAKAGSSAATADLGLLESDLGSNVTEQAKSRARELEATVTRVVVARGCTGWNGEFDVIPAPPPPDIQSFCR